MKRIICLLICLLVTLNTRGVYAETKGTTDITEITENVTTAESYKMMELSYPEQAEGWKNGVYHRRVLNRKEGDGNFEYKNGMLVAKSRMWQEAAKIGGAVPYYERGSILLEKPDQDYDIEVVLYNPEKTAYRSFLRVNEMNKTDVITVLPGETKSITCTVSVVDGKLELSVINYQNAFSPEQAVEQNAYIKEIMITEREQEEKGKIPTIFIAGDSVSATRDGGEAPREGMGQELYRYIRHNGKVKVTKHKEAGYQSGWYEYNMNTANLENRATCGESTTNFIETGKFDSILNKIRPDDCVLIQFAHNDVRDNVELKSTSLEDYKKNLRYFVRGIRQRGGTAVLMSAIPRCSFQRSGKVVTTAPAFRAAMKQVASEEGAYYLKLGEVMDELLTNIGKTEAKKLYTILPPYTYLNFPGGVTDISHVREKGAEKLAEIVASELGMKNIKTISPLMKKSRNYYKGLSKIIEPKKIKKIGKNRKKIIWKREHRAARYEVLSSRKKSGRYKKIGMTRKTSYMMKHPDKRERYRIRVVY